MTKTAKIGSAAATAAILFLMVLLFLDPARAAESCGKGIGIWAKCVLPSLFPFLFLTAILTRLGAVGLAARAFSPAARRLYRTGGLSAYVYLMSALSGYPVGSKLICDLAEAGRIGRDEATRMSAFCSTSGPLFVVGTVGAGMFGSVRAGAVMLAAHLLAGLLAGLPFRFYGKDEPAAPPRPLAAPPSDALLYDAAYSSVVGILLVGAFISLFYVLADLLFAARLLALPTALLARLFSNVEGGERIAEALAAGFLECTRGCSTLASVGLTPLTAALAAALVSFGGVCVGAQASAYLRRAGVDLRVYFAAKVLHALLAFALCLLFFALA